MTHPIIHVESLSKRYRVGGPRRSGRDLREAFDDLVKAPWRRLRSFAIEPASAIETFWALDDVDLEVAPGEVLGVVGANGAGKSTLLKILSRITAPTSGRVELRGRVASLLEVGTGFHPDLSGRDNVYLNGTLLGMRKKEIDAKFDEIVAFAEVERFIDTPVKRYSSGMYVRLAFAVAAHLEPEILLVDEVLAVGDASFQRKCLGKLGSIARNGRTVLFVSHNLAAMQKLCDRAILLERGRLVANGAVGDVVKRYLSASTPIEAVAAFTDDTRRGTGWARVVDVRMVNDGGNRLAAAPCDHDLRFEVDLKTAGAGSESLRGLVLELTFLTDRGEPVTTVTNVDDDACELPSAEGCTVRVHLEGPTFVPGRYRLRTFLGIPFLQQVDHIDHALSFEITAPEAPWRPYELRRDQGVVCTKARWDLTLREPDEISVSSTTAH